jgi:hypothetical protein
MKKILNQVTLYVLCGLLITSCVEVEFDCGMIETRIIELGQSVGTFNSNFFSSNSSLNFEEAAIQIEVLESIQEQECDEATFTPVPQIIESINITSSGNVRTGGVAYPVGESLNELFKVHILEQSFSISDFITAQNNDPLIFYWDSRPDSFVLQLLQKPDISINQSFNVLISFTDSEILSVEIPIFEVSN